MMKLPMVVVAIGLLLVGPAAAEECSRTYFPDTYKAGMAALAKKDTVSASRIFRNLANLANHGFAPAQRRLGEMLLDEAANRREALGWLRVAMSGNDELAVDSFLAARASAEESAVAIEDAKIWRPGPAECMEKFRAKFDAGSPMRPDEFVGELSFAQNVAPSPQILSRNLIALLYALYRNDPTFLPYLRAIPAVNIGPKSITAAPVRKDGKSVLVLDSRMLAAPDQKRLDALLVTVTQGIRTILHDQVDPPRYLKVNHRGRTILAVGHRDAEQAVEVIRKGIDLAETLPPDLRRLAGIVKSLRYEAPPIGVDVKSNGTFMRGDNQIWFMKNPRNTSAGEVAANLVGNGVFGEFAAKGEIPLFEAQKKSNYEARRARDLLP